MLLKIRNFLGISPRITPRNLELGMAQTARDTKLWNGTLRPFRQSAAVATLPLAGVKKALYRFGQDQSDDTQYWFAWTTATDVVRSSVPANERTYLADGVAPKVTDSSIALGAGALPVTTYDWGVPQPADAPTVGVSGAVGTGETQTLRYYVYTFVNAWGEEGPASPVSVGVLASPSQTITVSGMDIPAGGAGYSYKRVYETAAGSTASGFFQAKQVAAATTSTTFTAGTGAVPSTDATVRGVGSPLITGDLYPPPADLTGIRMCAGNFLGGVSANQVVFSAPDYLYGWPPKYAQPFDYSPVGIGVFGNTIVVATKGKPYVLQGTDPGQLQRTRIESLQGCVSRRSIVEMDGAVGWATATAFVTVDANGETDITAKFFDPDQWKALNPSTMHCYWWKKRLLICHDAGCLLLEPGQPPVTLSMIPTACFVDPLRDELYYVTASAPTALVRFDGGTQPLTYRWRSSIIRDTEPTNIAAVVVESSSYPVTLRTYGDGTLWDTVSIPDGEPMRMPAGELFSEYEFELEGTGEVFFLHASDSMEELKQLE